jgi:hypothetical protein
VYNATGGSWLLKDVADDMFHAASLNFAGEFEWRFVHRAGMK